MGGGGRIGRVLIACAIVAAFAATGGASTASAACAPRAGTPDHTFVSSAPEQRGTQLTPRADGHLNMGFSDPGMRSASFRPKRISMSKGAGATLARFDITWATTQPTDGTTANFSETDGAYCAAIDAGIRPI